MQRHVSHVAVPVTSAGQLTWLVSCAMQLGCLAVASAERPGDALQACWLGW